jgi:hypothetical protein
MQWRFLTGHASDCSQFTANLAIARAPEGVGLVNAYNAVYSQAANCANQGLNPSGPNPAAGGANGSPPAVSHGRG